jgi:hypothetical protein
MTGYRRLAVLALLAASVSLSACEAGGKPVPATEHLPVPASIGTVPTITSSSQIPPLPLDAYRITQDQYISILTATRIAARACMDQYGLDWHGNDLVDVANVGVDNVRLFTIIDADDAAQYGYEVPPSKADGRAPGVKPAPPAGYVAPSKLEEDVFKGRNAGTVIAGHAVPVGGCAAAAENRLLPGGIPGGVLTAGGTDSLGPWQQSKVDSRVQAAFAKWSSCMAAAGFRYQTPEDANNDTTLSGQAGIRTAVADVTCKQQNNVVGVWWAVLVAYEQEYTDAHAQDLQKAKEDIDTVIRNATTIIAAG